MATEAPTPTPTPQRGPRWYKRQTEVIDIAARLFAQNGYNATGVAELCEAVGLGKGSLYYYITSKNHLLGLIHTRVMQEVLRSAERVLALDTHPMEQLRVLGMELLTINTRYPDHVWVFLHEWRALEGDEAVEFKEKRAIYEEALARILQRGTEEGVFEIADLRLAVLAWLGMHNYTYQWYRREGRLTPFQIASGFHEMFLQGILADPGRAASPGKTRAASGAAEG